MAMMVSGLQYGTILLREVDGKPVVERADPIILVGMDLLVNGDLFTATVDGHLILAGQVRYRPIGIDDARWLICQRFDDRGVAEWRSDPAPSV